MSSPVEQYLYQHGTWEDKIKFLNVDYIFEHNDLIFIRHNEWTDSWANGYLVAKHGIENGKVKCFLINVNYLHENDYKLLFDENFIDISYVNTLPKSYGYTFPTDIQVINQRYTSYCKYELEKSINVTNCKIMYDDKYVFYNPTECVLINQGNQYIVKKNAKMQFEKANDIIQSNIKQLQDKIKKYESMYKLISEKDESIFDKLR